MKKTIIFSGLALVAYANSSFATNRSTVHTSYEVVLNTNTPLCNAIQKGDFATVKKFIDYGADVNEESNGMTPLMFAARYNKVEILKYLVEKGANKEKKDERGYTAKQYAEFSNSVESFTYLSQA